MASNSYSATSEASFELHACGYNTGAAEAARTIKQEYKINVDSIGNMEDSWLKLKVLKKSEQPIVVVVDLDMAYKLNASKPDTVKLYFERLSSCTQFLKVGVSSTPHKRSKKDKELKAEFDKRFEDEVGAIKTFYKPLRNGDLIELAKLLK